MGKMLRHPQHPTTRSVHLLRKKSGDVHMCVCRRSFGRQ